MLNCRAPMKTSQSQLSLGKGSSQCTLMLRRLSVSSHLSTCKQDFTGDLWKALKQCRM